METSLGSLLSLLIVLLPFTTALCGDKLEWSTVLYKIEVHADGSATWIVERRFLLETEADKTTFGVYASFEYFDEFRNNMSFLVSKAWLETPQRRNMTAENFKQKTGISGSQGFITYQFDWIGFADPFNDKSITIGEVFIGGIFLFGDGNLIMEYPSGYDAQAFPPPDDPKTLIWYEIKNFGVGEPRVVLEKRTPSIMDTLQEYALVISIFAFAGIGSACLWFFKFRRKEKEEVIGPVPRLSLEIEDDEDKVVRLLKAAGGRLYQSTISKQCRFSKSKASMLLIIMEKKGKVRRQKKGREKLVTLISEG